MTQYQPLEEEHLNVTTVAVNPAQRGTWHASLAWFWSIDVVIVSLAHIQVR